MAFRHHATQLIVTQDGYRPGDDYSVKQHARMKVGSRVGAEIARGRSVKQNQLYWSVLTRVVEAKGTWPTPEKLHQALKVHLGFIERIRLLPTKEHPEGKMVLTTESTSFDAMTHDRFVEFCDAAFKVIEIDIMDGLSIDEILTYGTRREVNAADEIVKHGNWGG